ncbi:S-layer homology domain-containing protein [Paenibacillus daejeonensis]|uniref:S-layer homology domain-containing protein n=1 Tax=Paenibacillus daejeonensis TaxID=135193 RepID=UPI0003A32C33|nr:S-layer homology domain-containing protein [Paenibacillus daejeonensis]
MLKKALSVLMAVALLLTIAPVYPAQVEANTSRNFVFNNEQYTSGTPRITTNERVTLNGTINNVIGSTITYSVYQISLTNGQETILNRNENQTTNISLSGSSITILNVQLFPGLNKITFKGAQGSAEVTDSIYIEYRNSPTLFNLMANLDGLQYEIQEHGTTVVHSTPSQGRASADISISGKAPNAERVTVIVNNRSYTYAVNSINDWNFVAAPVNIVKGKNTVTIRVFNNNQTVETTRDIAFYNGTVTFFDMNLKHDNGSASLENNPNFSVPNTNLTLEGKVIVPLLYDQATNAHTPTIPNAGLQYRLGNTGAFTAIPGTIQMDPVGTVLRPNDRFMTLTYAIPLSGANLTFDTRHTIQFQGMNLVKVPAGTDLSDVYSFTLRNSGLAYIEDINYLPGFTGTTTNGQLETMQGSDIENADIFSLPMGIEVLIGNYQNWTTPPANLVTIQSVRDAAGTVHTVGSNSGVLNDPTHKFSYIQREVGYVTQRNIDGVEQRFLRVFLEVRKLPSAGQQTLNIRLNNSNASTDVYAAPITLLYGPYANFTRLLDTMSVSYDTTLQSGPGQQFLIQNQLDRFRGELLNIANPNDIVYESSADGPQTVFMYINNTHILLRQEETTNRAKFIIKDAAEESKAFNALFKSGDNTIRFVFRTARNNYERSMKLTLVPTNLPQIPAENTDGVYPYSIGLQRPTPNDPKFPLSGNVFTTKEAEMNVYGTFDFIDLGTSVQAVINKLDTMNADRKNYMIRISTAGEPDINWSLENSFVTISANESEHNQVVGGSVTVPGLTVQYDLAKQSFSFILPNQQLPIDGSPKVYTITVFNSGETGPRATYRLEINPTTIPYTVLAPILEKRIMNQNFVEVVIASPGAESININKVEARKITYLDYSRLEDGQPRLIPAFSALVTDLRGGRDTRIDLIIRRGNDEIKDYFNVKYVPESIPGHQIMETMKNSHKLFDNQLTLSFDRNTNLIRTDYNVPDNLKGQVYNGHKLLFAIANPVDGVVDRHDFQSVPANYDLDLSLGKVLFGASFPQRYIKSSPVYWIDPGQADDATTPGVYDPIDAGVDPYPFSREQGVTQRYYFSRANDRELVPSKRGSLTLAYDPSIRQGAGTMVTVFRFDAFTQQWENIGGVVDDRKNTITVPFDRFGYYTVAKLSYGFNDITDHPYAREAMEAIFTKGVMNAIDPSGMFGGDQYVTRAEFARMIVRALEMPLNYDGANHFDDVPNMGNAINMNAIWDYRYIETAARSGFTRGTRPRAFDPESPIVRQDAAVMLAKALNMKLETDASKVRSGLQKAFRDEGAMDFYAAPSILAIQKKAFIQGAPVDINDPARGNVFQPKARLLRSDAAIIIAKVMADVKKLPKLYTQ